MYKAPRGRAQECKVGTKQQAGSRRTQVPWLCLLSAVDRDELYWPGFATLLTKVKALATANIDVATQFRVLMTDSKRASLDPIQFPTMLRQQARQHKCEQRICVFAMHGKGFTCVNPLRSSLHAPAVALLPAVLLYIEVSKPPLTVIMTCGSGIVELMGGAHACRS